MAKKLLVLVMAGLLIFGLANMVVAMDFLETPKYSTAGHRTPPLPPIDSKGPTVTLRYDYQMFFYITTDECFCSLVFLIGVFLVLI